MIKPFTLLARISKRIKRTVRVHLFPPPETRIFLPPRTLHVTARVTNTIRTGSQPKQVAVFPERHLAYVTCMRGCAVQEFSYRGGLIRTNEWRFPEQCVEVEQVNGLCYVTTTNFKRGSGQRSHLWILDPGRNRILSSTDTRGEWSKVIKVDRSQMVAYVSNWHSNDISIIDVRNPNAPILVCKVPCDEAPRGLAVRPNGEVLATSFYGSRIFAIGNNVVKAKSERFEHPRYGGNMRDILVTKDGATAWVSNLGRNMVHWYNASTLELSGSIAVSRQPNSIRFVDPDEQLLAVSCRADRVICFIDTISKSVIGVSETTGRKPTGLACCDGSMLVTTFDDDKLMSFIVSS